MNARPVLGLMLLLAVGVAAAAYLLMRPPAMHWFHGEDSVIATQTRIIAARDTTRDARETAYFIRARRYRALKMPQKAVTDYRAAMGLESPNALNYTWAERGIIESYAEAGDTRRARAALAIYATQPHHQFSTPLERAVIDRALHDDAAELADLNAAVAVYPGAEDSYLARSRYFERHGEHDKALADLDAVHRLMPGWDEYHLLRAKVLLHEWDVSGAWHEYALVYGAFTAQMRTVTLSAQAEREVRARQFSRAIADYSTLIARNPRDVGFRIGRADALLWAGQQDKAFADYQRSISDAPTRSDPYFAFGKAYFSLFRFDDALAQLRLAVIYSDGAAAHRVRGFVELDMNRDADAVKDFIAALAADRTDAFAVLGLHLMHLRDRTDDRAELARNAAAIAPHGWPAPLLAYAQGHITQAQLEAAAVRGADPDDAADRLCEAHYYVGRIALEKGDRAAAIPALQAAATSCHPMMLERNQAAWALKSARPGT